jgi:hypothetical protein
MGECVPNTEIIETLKSLNAVLTQPVWLFGGVAVDFLVGRWTRAHGDIDINAYYEHRTGLTRELNAIGFRTSDTGWLTHWKRGNADWHLEVVFLDRGPDNSGIVVIGSKDAMGVPGRYATIAGYLDPNRYATLDGVTFRVCSPAGEWLARAPGLQCIQGRPQVSKIEHDRLLIERLLSDVELGRLRDMASK